jgi:hypothetical protein
MHEKPFQLSGIVFVALVLVAVIGVGGATPDPGASARELASFYSDNAVRQAITAFLLAAATPFVVFFGVGLVTRFGSRERGGPSGWGYVLLTGTILVAGGVLLTSFLHFALVGADEDVSGTALQALNTLDANMWMFFNPAFGVMMLGAAGLLLAAHVHRRLAWIALALGILAFIPFADFFALLGTLAWIVVTSVVLARASERERAYVAAPGAT